MIFAELHGKLGTDYSLAHERAEDLLTSSVFQLLRYIPLEHGFLPLLRAIVPWSKRWPVIDHLTSLTVEPWPSLSAAGRPDLILKLHVEGHLAQVVVVEAKLYAGKSSRALEHASDPSKSDEETAAEIQPPLSQDQLAKYWQGLQRYEPASEIGKAVVYLTAHVAPPREELDESLVCDFTMRLGWLSWYHIWAVASNATLALSESLPAQDLCELLRHRGFATFRGFGRRALFDPPLSPHFFAQQIWFGEPSWTSPAARRFWREDE